MNWTDFHFLRPVWLLAFLPLAWGVWRLWRHTGQRSAWQRVVDPRLLSHLLIRGEGQGGRGGLLWVAFGFTLAILAQAGPTWERQPRPVLVRQAPLVILFDLSRSMDARDLKPSRLARARFKVEDLLARRREGQTALVVFAGAPFTVVPLTDDVRTIRAQLPALSTDLMPVQGSNVADAIRKAVELLRQAGESHGDVLLVSDGVNGPQAVAAAAEAHSRGYRVSVLAVGTPEGAPIPTARGSLQDRQGNLVLARLDESALRAVAEAGGGRYSRLTVDDADLRRLDLLQPSGLQARDTRQAQQQVERWKDMGPWLVLLVLPLAALAFRRGMLVVVLAVAGLLPGRPATAGWWQDLWARPDQQGAQLLERQQPEAAAQRFRDPRWKASALYRAGRYREAAALWSRLPDAESQYDLGNALAHAGRLEEARQAYRRALQQQPDFADARYNLALVEKWLQQHKNRQNPQKTGQKKQTPQKNGQKDGQQNQNRRQNGRQNQKPQQNAQQQNGRQNRNRSQESRQKNGGRSEGQQNSRSPKSDSASKDQADQARSTATEAHQPRQQASGGDSNAERHERQALKRELERRMEEARQQQRRPDGSQAAARQGSQPPPEDKTGKARARPLDERALSREQWLRRIPDDPGKLLRRKFRYYYQRLPYETPRQNPW